MKDRKKTKEQHRIFTEDEVVAILNSEKPCLCMICKAPGVLRYQGKFESSDYLKLQVIMNVVNDTLTVLFGV